MSDKESNKLEIESFDICEEDDLISPEGFNAYEGRIDNKSKVSMGIDILKKKAIEQKSKYKRRILYILNAFMTKPFKASILLSFIMVIFIETLSRRSLGEAVTFVYQKPLVFILNWLIVLVPYLISIAVKRKPIVYFLSTLLWAAIGIIDYSMYPYRTTPFTGVDLNTSTNEISVAIDYLGSKVILVIFVLIIVVASFVLLCIYCPKSKINMRKWKAWACITGLWVAIYATVILAMRGGILTTKFGNLGISYHEYGIAYCFTITVVDTGIAKPSDYSEEKIYDLVRQEHNKNNNKDDSLPNIIFLQLESFIDTTEIKDLKLSDDPTPTFRKLRKDYSSGYLTVPTIVAGTCNTEFEMITGMNLEFFGPGEYPYKTILRNKTCESAASVLKTIGYTAHGVHNHISGFYGRNDVYANMGFDTFTGVELMNDTTVTSNGAWTKDDVLTGCVLDCLKSTKGRDYVYTVSVQSHGMYNVDLPKEETHIQVYSTPGEEDKMQEYLYYINQIKEVDNFIKDLTEKLSDFDEKVILVMYGDHIPGLGLSDEVYKTDRTVYETEYVIWDNYGLKKKNKNYKAYELTAEVLKRAGIHKGHIFSYHQNANHGDESYLKNLENLQYDMLYGEKYAYNGNEPLEKTDIVYGVKDIEIKKVTMDENYLYVEGKNFNTYSKVFINDKKYEAELISSTLLRVQIKKGMLIEDNIIQIRNINSLDVEFRRTEEFSYEYVAPMDKTVIDDSNVGNISKDEENTQKEADNDDK